MYKSNLAAFTNDPTGKSAPALDLPGLKEMTLKAVDILHRRGGEKGFFLMAEGASIDKQMHTLDYDRALGVRDIYTPPSHLPPSLPRTQTIKTKLTPAQDLLELDDTVRATIAHLKRLNELENTLLLVTADHGHGFDVFGGVDTTYLSSAPTPRQKRRAVGVYRDAGLSQYTVPAPGVSYNTGANFPVNWAPRYALAQGFGGAPDHREDFRVHSGGPRLPAAPVAGFASDEYFANGADAVGGFVVNGTLPTDEAQGVHSLTDVPVFAMGPCAGAFGGVYGNVDIFYKMAECLGLGRPDGRAGKL